MAQDVNLAVRIATVLDAAGLNKAGKSVDGFDKKLKTLGRTLGVTLSGAAIAAFGKKAAQAFIADQKEAMRLTQVVKNLGLELSSPAINQYIDSLSKASGVTDSQLRPAFQALLTTTGSLTASQQALQQAIDVSVGSGIELTTVSQDLANAYIGQTRGLRKYNLGLTQAELKTASFEEISAKLNKQFSGANAAYLDSYAGKLQLLSTAAGEAQEKIGAAIIDLTLALAGTGSVDELVTKIDRMADRFVGLMDRFTEGVAIIKAMLGAKTWSGMFKAAQEAQVAEFNRRLKRDYMKVWEGTNMPKSAAQLAAERAAEAAARKRAEQLKKELEKQTKELKKQASLKKSNTVFDLEQIQLVAALKGKLSAEEIMRVQAQLALLNGNEAVAKQLTEQILKAQDASGNLSKFLSALPNAKNPFEYLDAYLSYLAGKAAAIAVGTPFGQVAPNGNTSVAPIVPPPTNVPTMPSDNMITYNTRTGLNYNPNANNVVELRIVSDGSKLIDAIAEGLQQKSLSTGDSSYINRRTGGFAG